MCGVVVVGGGGGVGRGERGLLALYIRSIPPISLLMLVLDPPSAAAAALLEATPLETVAGLPLAELATAPGLGKVPTARQSCRSRTCSARVEAVEVMVVNSMDTSLQTAFRSCSSVPCEVTPVCSMQSVTRARSVRGTAEGDDMGASQVGLVFVPGDGAPKSRKKEPVSSRCYLCIRHGSGALSRSIHPSVCVCNDPGCS